ncbi:hypothetical protein Tco_1003852 [Tanacetum coccineum]|uniref:DUF4283 domain-containing protein n=1 Tax=Tanacetum coccineum TaxID=301880 RepID=A0ABQ5FBD2_9ASTR
MTNASSLLSSSVLCLNKATQVFNEHFQMQKIVTINTIASTADPPPITVMIKKSMLLLTTLLKREVLSPSVVDETVAKEKQRSLLNTTRLGSFPPLPSQENLSTGNAPRKSLNANVTGKSSGKNVNFRTLFTPGRVAYPVVANYVRNTWGKYGMVRSMFSSSTGLFSFQFSSSDGLNAMLENDPWSSYARAMIELRSDVELKDNIVADMPKIVEEGYYTHNICVEYVWKRPRCACCKVFVNVLEECPKNIDFGVTKKKTSETAKGIPSIANNGGNKNKNVKPTNEVSKSNSFDALNSVDNDVEFGTNRGYTHLASQEANSSSSTFWNAESSSPSTTTPIIEKINKMENLIIDGKAILVNNEGKPLSKVDDDSEDEVATVDNEMAGFLAKEDGYGQEIPEMLQAFCNRLDINVRGRMKK